MNDNEFLTTNQLAVRWKMSASTLRNWRFNGTGPPYLKPGGVRGKALYRVSDIEQWENNNTTAVEVNDEDQ